MHPTRAPMIERLRTLAIAIPVAAVLIVVIGAAAYALDRYGIEGTAATVAMAIVGTIICIVVFGAGSFIEAVRARQRTREAARASAAWLAMRAEALARRRVELQSDPDPARRRYVAAIDRGELIDDAEIALREARIAQLRRDPAKHRYIERVFEGERISDRAIAYWLDPAMRVLCAHLEPIEAALRAKDPDMTPHEGRVVETRYALDWPLLRQRHPVPEFVELVRAHPRSEDGDAVHCTRCNATLLTGTGFYGHFPPDQGS